MERNESQQSFIQFQPNLAQNQYSSIPFRVGLATFWQYKQKIHDQMPSQIQQTLSNSFWCFQLDSQWSQILGHIITADCLQFQVLASQILQNSMTPPLLTTIVQINFPYLISLRIQDQNLSSIELISSLNINNLQRLIILKNSTTNIKPLNKQKWQNLERLSLQANRLNRLDLSRIKMSKQFRYLEYNFQRYKHNELERARNICYGDISLVLKLETQKIKFFRVHQDSNYLKQPKIMMKLRDRYPSLIMQPMYSSTVPINIE